MYSFTKINQLVRLTHTGGLTISLGDQFWQFLNSPVGLLLIGFLFTTVVGKFLSTWYQSASKRQEIRFVQLHQDRLKAIRDLHDRSVDVEKGLFNLLYKWRPVGMCPPFVDPKKVDCDVKEFRNVSEKSKIYFNLELCALIDALCETFESTLRTIEGAILNSKGQAPSFDKNAHEGVHIHSRELRSKLRNEFRTILGVD